MNRLAQILSALFLVAGLSLGWGCGASHVTDVSKDLDRGARLALLITRQAPAGYLNGAPADIKASMEAQGYVFRDAEYDYPPLAMQGHFLKVGDQFIAIGVDGVFFIPKGMELHDPTPVFSELSDAQPMGTVEVGPSLVASSDPLQTVVLRQQAGPLGSSDTMDGPPEERPDPIDDDDAGTPDSQLHVHGSDHTGGTALENDGCPRENCDTTKNGPKTCCLDFDLAKGRMVGSLGQLSPVCVAKRVWEYTGTVCDRWVQKNVCLLEAATGLGPYGCYRTHRYRYCQFLSEKDYSLGVPATATVTVGSKLKIDVHNNTPANETLVTRTGDAQGSLPASTAQGVVTLGPGQTRIDHYSEPKEKHLVDRVLTYQAPASLPSGKTEAYDTLTFSFWGQTQTITIKVVDRCKTKKGGKKVQEGMCESL